AAAAMGQQAQEIETILEKSRGREDRLHFIDFAGNAVRRDRGDPVFEGELHQTKIGAALEYTLAQMPAGRAARMLVITDGFATEPLGVATEAVLRSRVPLDFRLLTEPVAPDWRVSALAVPARVLSGESFLVEFTINGPGDGGVPWEVTRGGRVAASGTATARGGVARVRLTDRLTGTGATRYEARVKPVEDAHPENNAVEAWCEITGGGRVVLVSNYPDDPLATLLGAQGLTVDRVGEPGALTAARLTGARAVVINNVPAHRLSREFLGALDFFVREQGGGLLMAGGENSFGSGGYFASPIDELLPVSMELRKEQRKLATAMAIVMDRSGSMSQSAGGGLTKMDLADAGAARAVELLGDLDAATAPTAMLAESGGMTAAVMRRTLVWEKIEPGRFRTVVALKPGKIARGAVRVGATALPFGPITVAGVAEWAFDRARLAELQALGAGSGGRERLDLAEVWKAPRPVAWRAVRSWVLMTLTVLLVAEAALARLGYSPVPVRGRKRVS
ncbi:MAG: hypothetical protein H7343_04170, partial [Undibacterium sp.]|nr:hypothetical protein [Opitutaceae bacterium]